MLKKLSLKKMSITSTRGQSLVETAIIAPVLIFMLIGVFEVGWVLRGYLVLANVNREITRFAVRPGYMDFSTQENVITSYLRIRDWTLTSLAGQLEMDFSNTGDINDTGNTTLIVTHMVIDTGLPCEDIATCDCSEFMNNPNHNPFPEDDLIIYPARPGMEYQIGYFGPPETESGVRLTRIDYNDVLYNDNDQNGTKDDENGLIPLNNRFNCELIKKGGIPSANNIIITELYYDQPQLFGFPLISNPYTDPIPLYTQTTMRLISAARSSGQVGGDLTGNIDTIGPVCNVYPFAVRDTNMAGVSEGQEIDIFDGPGGGHYGWMAWNPSKTGENDLKNELKYSTISLNDFEDALDSSDHILGVGDVVAPISGDMGTVESDDGLVSALIDKKIRVPVWNSATFGSNGNKYEISSFVWAKINSSGNIDLDTTRTITATYLGNAAAECPP